LKSFFKSNINSFDLQLSAASTDDQVQDIIMKEATIDILQELGYTGVPYKETVTTVGQIVQ
jgi:hypothetical protein